MDQDAFKRSLRTLEENTNEILDSGNYVKLDVDSSSALIQMLTQQVAVLRVELSEIKLSVYAAHDKIGELRNEQ